MSGQRCHSRVQVLDEPFRHCPFSSVIGSRNTASIGEQLQFSGFGRIVGKPEVRQEFAQNSDYFRLGGDSTGTKKEPEHAGLRSRQNDRVVGRGSTVLDDRQIEKPTKSLNE